MQDCLQICAVVKMCDHTHVQKTEYGDTHMAQKTTETGLLAFGIKIKEEVYIHLLSRFQCYKYEIHGTKICPDKQIIRCSECGQQGQRWEVCKPQRRSA